MTNLVLIRHGQTDFNLQHRWQGWSDNPLNEVGRQQAARVACRLARDFKHVEAVYSSPLMRAYETARIIGAELGVPVRLSEGLREVHFGLLEGLTTSEFQGRYPREYEQFLQRHDLSYQYPDGESRIGFSHRVSDTIRSLIDRHPHDTIVVVCHGGTLRAMLGYFFPGQPETWERFAATNCAVTHVSINGTGVELLLLDDLRHLEAATQP